MHPHPYESNCIICGDDISSVNPELVQLGTNDGWFSDTESMAPFYYGCCSNQCLIDNLVSQMAEDKKEMDTLYDDYNKLFDKHDVLTGELELTNTLMNQFSDELDLVKACPWTNLLEYYKTKWFGKALALSLALLPLALAIHIAW
jgi:hypothetical protein